jgi:hypothetical protein
MPQTAFDLARVVRPFEVGDFLRDCWERRPLTIPRDDPEYFGGLFSLRDVDAVLAFTRPKFLGADGFEQGGTSPAFVQGLLPDDEPAKIASALRFVARTPRFVVRLLPDDLTADAKVVLARRLVRDRCLVVPSGAD